MAARRSASRFSKCARRFENVARNSSQPLHKTGTCTPPALSTPPPVDHSDDKVEEDEDEEEDEEAGKEKKAGAEEQLLLLLLVRGLEEEEEAAAAATKALTSLEKAIDLFSRSSSRTRTARSAFSSCAFVCACVKYAHAKNAYACMHADEEKNSWRTCAMAIALSRWERRNSKWLFSN